MSNLTDQIEIDVGGAFLNTDDWGEAATYTPNGGAGAAITVLFDSSFEIISMHDGIAVRSTQPAAFAKESDITGDADGDTILINAVTYYVTDKQGEAGTGMVLLLLSTSAIHG